MGKWLHNVLTPTDPSESGPHADVEDLARLVEGNLAGDERKSLLRHLNQCGQCNQILQETIKDNQQQTPQRKMKKGSETILLVEDEKDILLVTKILLEHMGYHVLASDNPEDGINISQ